MSVRMPASPSSERTTAHTAACPRPVKICLHAPCEFFWCYSCIVVPSLSVDPPSLPCDPFRPSSPLVPVRSQEPLTPAGSHPVAAPSTSSPDQGPAAGHCYPSPLFFARNGRLSSPPLRKATSAVPLNDAPHGVSRIFLASREHLRGQSWDAPARCGVAGDNIPPPTRRRPGRGPCGAPTHREVMERFLRRPHGRSWNVFGRPSNMFPARTFQPLLYPYATPRGSPGSTSPIPCLLPPTPRPYATPAPRPPAAIALLPTPRGSPGYAPPDPKSHRPLIHTPPPLPQMVVCLCLRLYLRPACNL